VTGYHFKAVTSDGKVRTGVLQADNEKRVATELRKQGLIPVYVGPNPQARRELKLPKIGGGQRKDVLFFTQELSTLLTAGVPVDRALQITSELTERSDFKPVIMDVLRSLKGGRGLADSLQTHPECFAEFYVNMVRAGEASGSLSSVFERLSEYERGRNELRSYIVSSMVYPVLLAMVGMASITILMYYVVPKFSQVFAESHMPIPTPTRMLLQTSAALKAYGAYVLGALVGAIVAFRVYIATPPGRYWWDGFRLKLPLLGDALRKMETARFARAMGTLVANSVPLVQCLSITRAILGNRRMADSLEAVSQGVKRGEGVSGPLEKTKMFPPLASHLLSIGEETGRLDAMFLRMAEIYEEETRAAVKRFTALFEPLIILVMGVLVGVLILSMMMAITSINDVAV
jgi:general secretion pathway protein F